MMEQFKIYLKASPVNNEEMNKLNQFLKFSINSKSLYHKVENGKYYIYSNLSTVQEQTHDILLVKETLSTMNISSIIY